MFHPLLLGSGKALFRTHRLILISICFFLFVGPIPTGWSRTTNPQAIKVLIVDGFSNHDWRETTRIVQQILTNTYMFAIDVSTAPSSPGAQAWDTWRPRFRDYDVVIQNTNNIGKPQLRWPRQVEAALEDYVQAGGGLYILHSANNAFSHWPAYDQMIGLGWRNKNAGTALEVTSEGKLIRIGPGQGRGTSHGPLVDTAVRILNSHPINQGFPRSWRAPYLEVYVYARGPAQNLTVLSYAHDAGTQKHWPIDWVVQYGRGRVYNATFGHLWCGEDRSIGLRCVGFQTTLIRATEWLATGKVTWPIPSDFPTESKIRVRELKPESKLYTFNMNTITGQPVSLSDYQDKVLLMVNVASRCGFTKQYAGLQALYDRYRDRGLVVLGFPANNFGQQEPGTDAEIQTFCSTQFSVTFPLFSKVSVRGENIHPLYAYLTDPQENKGFGSPIQWNFNKFLIGKDGKTIARYPSKTEPLGPELIRAIEEAL